MNLNNALRSTMGRFLPQGKSAVSPISIVVPARNAETTIERMLDSVFAQTSKAWELVVVDDGSTDGTRDVVERVRGAHPVQIIDGPQQGVSAARNLGTEVAQFDYVLYLDADDWIGDRFVELMGGALAANPSKAGARCIWAYETPDGRTKAWDDLDLSDFFAASAARCPFAIHACVIDRRLVLEVGGFDTSLVIGEDWDLWQRVGRAGAELVFVEEVLAYYYLRAESVMHRDLDRMQADLLDVAQRGNRADPRVPNPIERYRDGIPADPALNIEAEMLAGTMAVAVPIDVELASLIPSHPADLTKDITADHVAGAIHEAVAFGSCSLLDEWPELYPRYLDRINEMLEALAGWLEQPDLPETTLRMLESIIARSSDTTGLSAIGETALAVFDIADGVSGYRADAEHFERLEAGVKFKKTWIGHIQLPVIGGVVEADMIADAIAIELGPRLVRRSLTTPELALRLATHLPKGTTVRSLRRALLDTSWSGNSGAKKNVDQFARWTATSATAALLGRTPPTPSLASNEASAEQLDNYGELYFDDIFSEPDPWLYSGPYEQTKYEQTLEVLGDRQFPRALEMACAEGHFTVQLAPRVDQLIAADISPTALERAAERCAEHANIEFRQVDLRDEKFPQDLDLLVCSEVLYFVESEPDLKDVARRFADALNPGGLLVMAHANLVVDDPHLTGFEWEHEFGARRIGEIIATEPKLRHVSTSMSELYRIHVFERRGPDTTTAPAVETAIDYAEDLDPHIRRMALWGGAQVLRRDLYESETSQHTPILMYHRVSPTGHAALDDYRVTPEQFEAQLNLLRSKGYYGITLEEWRWAMVSRRPPVGRAVMLTFDDGYTDFIEHAWPLLRDYDFPSVMFVVRDRVGQTADWDARFGEPPSLMDWDQLRFLQKNGVEIASHSDTHVAAINLKPSVQLANEQRARQVFQQELGRDVRSVAYPFGEHDEFVRATFRKAGYDLGFTTHWGLATVWENPMSIPRINVGMGMDLTAFERYIGAPAAVNPLRKGLRDARGRLSSLR